MDETRRYIMAFAVVALGIGAIAANQSGLLKIGAEPARPLASDSLQKPTGFTPTPR